MVTPLDLLYLTLFALVLPLLDYAFYWPAFRRRSQVDGGQARTWLWAWTVLTAWPVVALGAVLWKTSDRSWVSFGFSALHGWRFWAATGMCLALVAYFAHALATLARSSEARASVRRQFGKLTSVLPQTRREMYWFGAVSLTAGFCEEFLFRGYFIWVLAPWLGWWGAASLSVVIFAIWHAYQGWNGALRTGIVGAVFTVVLAIFGSLWPAIALHALIDLGHGMMAWIVLREGEERGA